MSDRSIAEASNTEHSQETVIHVTGGIRTRNPQKANGRRPTP